MNFFARMMLIINCLFICLLAPRGLAHAAELHFPTADQFLALSDEQQLQYLRGLREIAASMTHESSLFAEYRSQFLQYLVLSTHRLANAGASDFDTQIQQARTSFDYFKNNSKRTSDREAKRKMAVDAFKTLARAFDQATANDDRAAKVAILAAYRQLETALAQPGENLTDGIPASSITYISSQGKRLQTSVDNPPTNSPGARVFAKAAERKPAKPVAGTRSRASQQKERAASPAVGASPRPQASAAPTPGTSPKPAPSNAPVTKANSDLELLRQRLIEKLGAQPMNQYDRSGCMYAGNILLGSSCEPPTALPEYLQEKFKDKSILDPEKFKCKQGQALCNPLLFGFDFDAKTPDEVKTKCEDIAQIKNCFQYSVPICIPADVTATRICKKKTESEKYIKRAQELIKAKPEAFTIFTENYKTICDKDFIDKNRFVYQDSSGKPRSNSTYYRDDILNTCEGAASRFDKLYESTIGTKFDFKKAAKGGTPGGGGNTSSGAAGSAIPAGKNGTPVPDAGKK